MQILPVGVDCDDNQANYDCDHGNERAHGNSLVLVRILSRCHRSLIWRFHSSPARLIFDTSLFRDPRCPFR